MEVKKTSREVIEGKLLAALEDENAVAILASREDLDRNIVALRMYQRRAYILQDEHDDLEIYIDGLKRLRLEAFGD